MNAPMLAAVVLLCLGCWICSLLRDASIVGMRAVALCALAVGLWLLSMLQAVIAVIDRARRLVEAAGVDMPKPAPPEPQITTNLLEVSTGHYVLENILAPGDLRALAFGLLEGRPFSEREWRKEIPAFRLVQDEFERRGLVRITGKKRRLSGRGRLAMLRAAYFREGLPSPAGE